MNTVTLYFYLFFCCFQNSVIFFLSLQAKLLNVHTMCFI